MFKAGLRKLRKITGNYYRQVSYAQCGEDLIIRHILEKIKLEKFNYLEIGTNHPIYFNNTYLFYKMGFSGVCVEPDPTLCKQIRLYRKRDKCLNVGISAGPSSEADFYIMNVNTLNTFAKEDAEKLDKEGTYTIKKVIKVPLKNINDIIAENFNGVCPNLISIDVEGWNEEIIKSFDFNTYKPDIFCVETITFATDNTEKKLDDIISLITSHGYVNYADTNINTIFIAKKHFQQ